MTVASEFSFDFIAPFIDRKVKVLEIGCGKGELALRIQNSGTNITAIDIDPVAIEMAIQKKVNATVCDLFDVNETFDVLLFTRSLHHIHKLEKAIIHAKNIISPGGIIILEEFDYLNINVPTAKWYYNRLDELSTDRSNQTHSQNEDYLERWMEDHTHTPPLNSGNEMIKQIENNFRNLSIQKAPYLFRSIEEELSFSADSILKKKKLLKEETDLIKSELILPVGLRLVGFK